VPELLHLTGMPQAIPNTETKDIRFALSVSEGEPVMCVAPYGVAVQISSGLGTATQVLRMALTAQGEIEPVAAEQIQLVQFQKEQWSDVILMQLTTVQGVPYIFQFPSQYASEIVAQLKTEAAKPTQVGNA
jgi:hypothetical protein